MSLNHVPPKRVSLKILPAATLVALAAFACEAQAQTQPAVQRGVTLARTHCAQCHSIDRLSPSPLTIAPPFRDLHRKYPVENLQESLVEGLVTGHPAMPEFRFAPDQVRDFIVFLKTLR